jgi:hypothetical protein
MSICDDANIQNGGTPNGKCFDKPISGDLSCLIAQPKATPRYETAFCAIGAFSSWNKRSELVSDSFASLLFFKTHRQLIRTRRKWQAMNHRQNGRLTCIRFVFEQEEANRSCRPSKWFALQIKHLLLLSRPTFLRYLSFLLLPLIQIKSRLFLSSALPPSYLLLGPLPASPEWSVG